MMHFTVNLAKPKYIQGLLLLAIKYIVMIYVIINYYTKFLKNVETMGNVSLIHFASNQKDLNHINVSNYVKISHYMAWVIDWSPQSNCKTQQKI